MNVAATNCSGEFSRSMYPYSQQISYGRKAPGFVYIEVTKEIIQELQIYHNSGQGHRSELN